MATLTLTIANITATADANNAKAQTVLQTCVTAWNGPIDGTPQEQADFIVSEISILSNPNRPPTSHA